MTKLEKLNESFDILNCLEEVSGRNDKKALLKNGESNDTLKRMFYLAYNPFLRFNIHDYGEVVLTDKQPVSEGSFEQFEQILDALNRRIFTGHEAIGIVNDFFNKLSKEEYKWYSRVLKKDLRVGVTAKTFNSVYKKHIPIFECMLAKAWKDVKKKPEKVVVEPKLDGYRMLAFVENGSTKLFTRNGKLIEGFDKIEADMSRMPDSVYDGEVTGKKDPFADMQKTVFKKVASGKEGFLNLFDVISLEEFKTGKSNSNILVRKTLLTDIVRETDLTEVKVVECSLPISPGSSELDKIYQAYLESGYEGLMVKDADGLYECKRSSSWAKLKPVENFDLEVIGYEEGRGNFAGTFGAFVVDFNGQEVRVGTGTGFTQDFRIEAWKDPASFVGKIIEIEAQQVTENQKGTNSLRFPSFKKIRLDKE